MKFLKASTIATLAIASTLILPNVSFAATRITAAQAETAALNRIPGRALSAKYEFEEGHWQYAVLVKRGSTLYEVEVNAQSGRVTDYERTTPGEERREAASEKGGD